MQAHDEPRQPGTNGAEATDTRGPAQHAERQFALLRTRRFLPLFLTQFLGAFNDNLYKTALLVVVVFGLAESEADLLTNLAAGLFIAPFFLFSAAAGQLADRFDKARIIRLTKTAEIFIMALAAWGWATASTPLLFAALFLMGVQSAFFGPSKYAILPQHLGDRELVGGNAQLEMSTFAAILVGTIAGGALAASDGSRLLGPLVVSVAVLGLVTSCAIPAAPAQAPGLTIDWNPLRAAREMLRGAREKHYSVLLSILGISWFWLLGSAYLTQLPSYVAQNLYADSAVVTLLLGGFTAGIGIGALLCDRMSGHRIEIGLVPFGALGISLFGIHLSTQSLAPADTPHDLAGFFAAGGLPVLIDVVGLTMFGGFFIVPLYAFVQQRSPPEQRARMIALNNIVNALFMVVAAVLGALLLHVAGLSIPDLFLTLALMNIAVSLFVFRQVPLFAARFLIWVLSHTLYRVRHEGLEQIPQAGGALIACNHVSYVDALLLAGAVRRPIRFIMVKTIYDLPVLSFVFRTVKAIPIIGRRVDPEAYERAFHEVDRALAAGELVCIFPEGALTRDGELAAFKPGIEKILARRPVPVVPMALRGLWGSFFSAKGGFLRSPSRFWSRVEVVAGAPLGPEGVTAAALAERILELRGEWR
jgi:1-acyl-sn-glycerol-3-phosphate acyltransferase